MPVIPLGACQIAEAAEEAGHDVDLLDLMFERNPERTVRGALQKGRYDAIGLSVRNIDNNSMQDPHYYIAGLASIVSLIRAVSDAPVILGGPAVAIMPGEILRATGSTCAVVGSGARTFIRLLERIELKSPFDDLPGIVVQGRGEVKKTAESLRSLEENAAPDFGRWIDVGAYRSRLATAPLRTKLGCGFKCVYCTYRAIEGEGHILQDPGATADSVQNLVDQGFRDFEFVDSVFNSPPGHALAVCEALARRGLPARFQSMDVNPLFMDDELLVAMERAGFSGMGMTVESASDPVLAGLRKGFTAVHVHRAAGIIRRHDVPCLWIFLFGGPGETEETVRETLCFAEQEIRPQDAAFFTVGIRVYPGTELESIGRRQGVLAVSPAEMLAPVFYTSPDVDLRWMKGQVEDSVRRHLNFMAADSLGLPYLPALHWFGYRLGLTTPLWRHTRHIRRGLRLLGMEV